MINHLQTEHPKQSFIEWFSELCVLFGEAWGIDKISASKRLNKKALEDWYNDGFTPNATFRENYKPLF